MSPVAVLPQLRGSVLSSWLLLWLGLCGLCTSSKRLDFCEAQSLSDVTSGSGSGSGSGTTDPQTMPPVFYFQTAKRSPNASAPTVRMHYAWSGVGYPTLFLSQTNDSRDCNDSFHIVNNAAFLDSQSFGSVNITGAGTTNSLAIVFRRLIEYDGGNHYKASNGFNTSMAASNDSEQYRSVYLNDSMEWLYYPDGKTIVGKSLDDSFGTLKLRFQLPSREETKRISYFPKTQYTQNSIVFDITIDNFNYTKKFNGRVVIEMIMVNGQVIDKSSTDQTLTEDDEYTPSVFKTLEYYFQPKNVPNRAFLQWKPVSYQSKSRKSTQSQQANVVYPSGRAIDLLGDEVPRSLASALFSDDTPLNGTAMYIVLGTSGDETYINSDYQTWTAMVGFGKVPRDTISTEIIIVIIVALGIPVGLILLGAVYVTYKKKPWQNVARGIHRLRGMKGYERIN